MYFHLFLPKPEQCRSKTATEIPFVSANLGMNPAFYTCSLDAFGPGNAGALCNNNVVRQETDDSLAQCIDIEVRYTSTKNLWRSGVLV